MPLRLSAILRALEDRGEALDQHAMVWIDSPEAGCYVRACDVRRIETYFRGTREVWSRVKVALPSGETDTLVDRRSPKTVNRAIQRAELRAASILLDELRDRFGP